MLSERGASLAISDIDEEELRKINEEYSSKGVEILTGTVDVTEKKSLDAFVSQVISKFGQIDVCVPNAGAIGGAGFGTRKDYNDQDWNITWNVNVRGLVNTTDSVKEHMKEREEGKIVIVASQGGRKPRGKSGKGSSCGSRSP